MKPKIVVTRTMTKPVMERIEREFDAVLPTGVGISPEQALEALASSGAVGLLFTSALRASPAFIEQLPASVKVAASCSVGFDHIDVAAAKAKGVVFTNTPGVLDASVADFAFMLLIAAAKRLYEYDATVRTGWERHFGIAEFLGKDLAGKTLAIVGMGRIGQALARRARAFDMKIVYHNRTRLAADKEEGATWYRSLDDMLPHADFLSLHAPATAETKHLVNARTIALLPKGAVVINTARGPLVKDEALIEALKSGHLFSAGLDVFEGEPKVDPRYKDLPNVILAPHMASATEETRTAMGMLCLDNIAAVVSGKPAATPL